MLTSKHKVLGGVALTFLIIGIIGFWSNAISDQDAIVAFVLKELWPFILIWSVYFSYENTFGYDGTQKWWRLSIGCLCLAAVVFMLTSFSIQSILNLINSRIGQQQERIVSGQLIKKHRKKHAAGNTSYELTVLLYRDSLDLKVNEQYFLKYIQKESFQEKMKLGSMGFLYKKRIKTSW